jgi:WD40 repeat protein
VATLSGHSGPVRRLAFSKGGGWLVSASVDRTVRLWDVQSHKAVAILSGHGAPVNDVALSQVAERLYSSGSDGTVKLWNLDATTGGERW